MSYAFKSASLHSQHLWEDSIPSVVLWDHCRSCFLYALPNGKLMAVIRYDPLLLASEILMLAAGIQAEKEYPNSKSANA